MKDRVSIAVRNGIADVRLDRPDKRNAIDAAMFEAIAEAGAHLRGLRGLRAAVLSGNGAAFCAGLDLKNFGQMAAGDDSMVRKLKVRTHGDANLVQHIVHLWRELPVPVIAAIHGVAFGGGFELSLGADIRIIAPEARMSIMEIKWGLIPDMGGVSLMRALARDDVIRELTYSGRQFDGREAVSLGFATRTAADPRAEALALAAEIAARSPDAIRAAKRLYNRAADATQAELLLSESVEQQALIGGRNQIEAVTANLEKRAPVFFDD
ncbi:MAG: crotonase/enoyl-CoA hydratase family protein [Steroidobacteraceae bacterium]